MHRQYPSITRLPVHLENQQTCYYGEDENNAQDVLDRCGRTPLTEWFKINSQCPETRHLKYMNFTDFYVWNKNLKTWTKRQEKESVGRMVFVSPDDGERYFLRLLLTHVAGARSYDCLKTVNGIIHESFKGIL